LHFRFTIDNQTANGVSVAIVRTGKRIGITGAYRRKSFAVIPTAGSRGVNIGGLDKILIPAGSIFLQELQVIKVGNLIGFRFATGAAGKESHGISGGCT